MLQEIVLKLKSMTHSEIKSMSKSIGISFDCLISIRYGRIKNPKLETFLKIQAYFEK